MVVGIPAHDVMHRRDDRDWLLVGIDSGEYACRFDDTGKPLLEYIRPQMFEMEMNVVFLLPHTASFADFNRFRSADHVA